MKVFKTIKKSFCLENDLLLKKNNVFDELTIKISYTLNLDNKGKLIQEL